MYKKPPMAVFI
ncbi:hypothetical protein VCHC67A1_01301A, partial [Vibrio cholerae HC-67A1]